MKFKVFIIIAVFAAIQVSCGSGKTLKPQDTTADLDEDRVKEICEEHEVECGDFIATVNGSMKALFCGECEKGFTCDDATNKCKNESDTDEPADDSDGPDDDSDDSDDDSDNQPQEAETRDISCTGLPENAEWNIVSEIVQTKENDEWIPSEKGVFNAESSTNACRFICKENYVWNSKECVAYTPSGLPKCRANVTKPCEDPATGIIWSEIILTQMDWGNAKAYCDDFDEGGYTDWRLPNIDEMRTVIRNCSQMIPGGECPVSELNGNASGAGNYDSDERRLACSCSGSDDLGTESIIGNRHKVLWTSTTVSDIPVYAWTLDSNLSLSPETKESKAFAHCIRSDYFLHDSHCDKHYTWDGSECTPDTRTTECAGLPENAEWNAVSSITQTWDGTNWIPSAWANYNKNSSSSECRFKCYEEFTWDGNECVLD